MAEYIDKSIVTGIPLKDIYIRSDYNKAYRQGWADALELVKLIPAADVRENVRGAWVHGRETAREMLGDNTAAIFYEDYSCSSCGFKIDTPLWNWDGSLVYKFCPNCGASMWGKEYETD